MMISNLKKIEYYKLEMHLVTRGNYDCWVSKYFYHYDLTGLETHWPKDNNIVELRGWVLHPKRRKRK